MNKNKEKQVYNEKICKFCKNQKECNLNKFAVFTYQDKVSMKCANYEYINNE